MDRTNSLTLTFEAVADAAASIGAGRCVVRRVGSWDNVGNDFDFGAGGKYCCLGYSKKNEEQNWLTSIKQSSLKSTSKKFHDFWIKSICCSMNSLNSIIL